MPSERAPLAPALALAGALTFFVSFAQLVAARLAESRYGAGPVGGELASLAIGLGGILGCLLAGLAVKPRAEGEAKLAARCLAAAVWIGLAALGGPGWWGYLALLALAGLAVGAAVPVLLATMAVRYTPAELPAAVALATALTYAASNLLELLRAHPATAGTLAALGVLPLAIGLGAFPGPARNPEGPGRPRVRTRWLALVVFLDALGFGIVIASPLAGDTFAGLAHLSFNAAAHALGAALGALCMLGLAPGAVLAGGAATMGWAHLAMWMLGPGPLAGWIWSALAGVGVGLYHVPFFVELVRRHRSGGLDRLAWSNVVAGWVPAGVGLLLGRALTLVGDPCALLGWVAAGLGLAGLAAAAGREP